MSFGPIVPSWGPPDAKIMFLAEAPGDRETELLRPMVGPAGAELRRMLSSLGVELSHCRKTNVFSRQPSSNNLHLYGTDNAPDQFRDLGPLTSNPQTWLDRAHLPELARVQAEIISCAPNVLVPLGGTACWALGLGTGISSLRGSVHLVEIEGLDRPLKVLPTYHPGAVLRDWSLRTVALADLEKARVESQSPLPSFDNTLLWLNPTLEDLLEFDQNHMAMATVVACDIETKRGQITAISFAPTPTLSLCIPFWLNGPHPHYWPSAEEEVAALSYIRKWLEAPSLKVFQNGLYDLQYLHAPPYSIRPVNCTADTMLAHHSLFSELQKGLGFLGSIYANVPSWKKMRTFKKEEALKRDD